MYNKLNSVEVQGTVNTVELNQIMNLYTQSFTEGFIKMIDNYTSEKRVESRVQTISIPKSKSVKKVLNKGFEKLKTPSLKSGLQSCSLVDFDPKKHIRLKDLGVRSVYDLDKRSNTLWSEYFKTNKVYLDKGVNTLKISKKILFDKSVQNLLKKNTKVSQ